MFPSSFAVMWPFHGLPMALTFLLLALLPSIIAIIRQHHNRLGIVALNVLLGWTIVGWAAALVWSLTAVIRKTSSPTAFEHE